jgi:hypothetical protein
MPAAIPENVFPNSATPSALRSVSFSIWPSASMTTVTFWSGVIFWRSVKDNPSCSTALTTLSPPPASRTPS